MERFNYEKNLSKIDQLTQKLIPTFDPQNPPRAWELEKLRDPQDQQKVAEAMQPLVDKVRAFNTEAEEGEHQEDHSELEQISLIIIHLIPRMLRNWYLLPKDKQKEFAYELTHTFNICITGNNFKDGFMSGFIFNGPLITTWMTFVNQYAQLERNSALKDESQKYLAHNFFEMENPLNPRDGFRVFKDMPGPDFGFTLHMFEIERAVKSTTSLNNYLLQNHINLAETVSSLKNPHKITITTAIALAELYKVIKECSSPEIIWKEVCNTINRTGRNSLEERFSLILAMYGIIGYSGKLNELVSFFLDQLPVSIDYLIGVELLNNLKLYLTIPHPSVWRGILNQNAGFIYYELRQAISKAWDLLSCEPLEGEIVDMMIEILENTYEALPQH